MQIKDIISPRHRVGAHTVSYCIAANTILWQRTHALEPTSSLNPSSSFAKSLKSPEPCFQIHKLEIITVMLSSYFLGWVMTLELSNGLESTLWTQKPYSSAGIYKYIYFSLQINIKHLSLNKYWVGQKIRVVFSIKWKTQFSFSPVTLLIWIFWVCRLSPPWQNVDCSKLTSQFDRY